MWLQFTDHGIEGVVPLELLPPDVRSKYQAKPNDKSKRAKKDESKGAAAQAEENQVSLEISSSAVIYSKVKVFSFNKWRIVKLTWIIGLTRV